MTRRGVLAVGALVLVVGLAALWYVVGQRGPAHDVAVPPDGATPAEVVTSYLDALAAHDCSTASDLWRSSARSQDGDWCTDLARLTGVEIGAAVREPVGRTGAPPVVAVPVTLVPHWRWFHGDDSMPGGSTVMWGYELQRSTPAGPWRITGQGTG